VVDEFWLASGAPVREAATAATGPIHITNQRESSTGFVKFEEET